MLRASVRRADSSRRSILALPAHGVCSTTLCIDDRFDAETYSAVEGELADTVSAAIAAWAACAIHGPFGQPSVADASPSTMSCITSGVSVAADGGVVCEAAAGADAGAVDGEEVDMVR